MAASPNIQIQKSISVGDNLFYIADDGVHGQELWRTSLLTGETSLVKNMSAGSYSTYISTWASDGQYLYFDVMNGQFWKTDGTDSGTVQVEELSDSRIQGSIGPMRFIDGTMYFLVNKSTLTNELWKFTPGNGTASLLKSFDTSQNDYAPRYLRNLNGNLVFLVGRSELWKSDGTANGTALITTVPTVDSTLRADSFTVAGGLLYFINNDGIYGDELWRTDGTAAGTYLLKDLSPESLYTQIAYRNMVDVNGILYFVARRRNQAPEIWRTDGTEPGTIHVVSESGTPSPVNPVELTNSGGKLYFFATVLGQGSTLWKCDGPSKGTEIVTGKLYDSNVIPFEGVAESHGNLYFMRRVALPDTGNYQTYRFELWYSDGTDEGTRFVRDIVNENLNSNNMFFIAAGGKAFFLPYDAAIGAELWWSDGTQNGTALLRDIRLGTKSSKPGLLVTLNGFSYFTANDGVHGEQLWKSDGTSSGTVMVSGGQGFPPMTNGFSELFVFQGLLYFVDDAGGLWKSDGTATGTQLVVDLGIAATLAIDFEGVLYFAVGSYSTGYQLWKSDGTAGGTVMVKQFPASVRWAPSNFTVAGSLLYFTEADTVGRYGLWKSDGTEAGTVLVDPEVVSSYNAPNLLTAFNNRVYFSFLNQLWVSDGTPQGTMKVANLEDQWDSRSLTTAEGEFYFVTSEPSQNPSSIYGNRILWKLTADGLGAQRVTQLPPNINEVKLKWFQGSLFLFDFAQNWRHNIWKLDRSSGSVALVSDLGNLDGYQLEADFFENNGMLVFSVRTLRGSSSLWRTDGTASGTILVKDLEWGSDRSYWYEVALLDHEVIFPFDDGMHGLELWSYSYEEPTLSIDAGGTYQGLPLPAHAIATGANDEPVEGLFTYHYYQGDDEAGIKLESPPLNAGTYTVVVEFRSTNPGYVNTRKATTYQINPALPSVTAFGNSGVYNGQPFTGSATVQGLNGEPIEGTIELRHYAGIEATGTYSLLPPVEIGTHAVIAVFTSLDPNYQNGTSTPAFIYILLQNTSPVLDNRGSPTLDTLIEDVSPAFNDGIGIIDLIQRMRPEGGISDLDPGAFEGVGILQTDVIGGRWEYRLNDAMAWSDIDILNTGYSRLLAADQTTRIRFVPNPDYFGSSTFSFSAWDRTSGTNGGLWDVSDRGGMSPLSLEFDVASITVLPVDDAPTAVDDTATTPEDTPTIIDLLDNDTDPDTPHADLAILPGTLGYRDADGIFHPGMTPNGGTVSLRPDGQVDYTPAPNFNGQDSFEYALTDGIVRTSALDGELQVNTSTADTQTLAQVAIDADGDYVVVWTRYDLNYSRGDVYARRFDSSGVPMGEEFRVNSGVDGFQYGAVVAMDAVGNFVIAWLEASLDYSGRSIIAQWFDSSGSPVAEERQIQSPVPEVNFLAISMNRNGDSVISWTGRDSGQSELEHYGKRFAPDGVEVGEKFQVNSTIGTYELFPSIAVAGDGSFVCVWEVRISNPSPLPQSYLILGQLFDSNGAKFGNEFQVNDTTDFRHSYPTVATNSSGDFVVTWSRRFDSTGGLHVVARRYSSNGTLLGNEILVDSGSSGSDLWSQVVMHDDGSFIISWESKNVLSSNDYDVMARRFDPEGNPIGSEFRINSTTTGYQYNSDIAMDDRGNFIIVWEGDDNLDDDFDIFAQRFETISPTQFGQVTVNVTPVNDAPVLNPIGNPTLDPITLNIPDANNP
ncbi:MAG: cadherin-like domain-containing protein, partial [Planctomycetaceae bacterium]|nr:cadherin-like domain-containing protein [Planctomycetaceae bacterium]